MVDETDASKLPNLRFLLGLGFRSKPDSSPISESFEENFLTKNDNMFDSLNKILIPNIAGRLAENSRR